jgi:methylthioribose-1-phosphate isomerase
MSAGRFQSVVLTDDGVRLLDQRRLPHETVYRVYAEPAAMAEAIRDMVVRGAPAIGAAAAYALAFAARSLDSAALLAAAQVLAAARPTAVNLAWAVDRMVRRLHADGPGALADEAARIAAEDVATNLAIAEHGQALVPDGATVIHHCNTGSLATIDYGTALGVLRVAHERGKRIHVFLDETRPRLQGAALSAWELAQLGIPHTVIVDGASGLVMSRRAITCCLVGCDRVAANGDVANKIGTYNLALVARAHGVPFYVAAPRSTVDLATACGADIEIEERPPTEITHLGGTAIAPAGTPVFNPAFDVTPAELITAIITEHGVLRPPYGAALARLGE